MDLPKADAEGNLSNTVVVRGAPSVVDGAIEKMQAFVHRLVILMRLEEG